MYTHNSYTIYKIQREAIERRRRDACFFFFFWTRLFSTIKKNKNKIYNCRTSSSRIPKQQGVLLVIQVSHVGLKGTELALYIYSYTYTIYIHLFCCRNIYIRTHLYLRYMGRLLRCRLYYYVNASTAASHIFNLSFLFVSN